MLLGLSIVGIIISVACLAVAIVIAIKISKKPEQSSDVDQLTETLHEAVKMINEHTALQLSAIKDIYNSTNASSNTLLGNYMSGFKTDISSISNSTQYQLSEIRQELKETINQMRKELSDNLTNIKSDISTNLDKVRQENNTELEKMRETVGEKLSSTLQKRFSEAFETIGNRIDSVQKGFGEMQALSERVGDLNKVFNNIKTRGGWGEVSLESLLDQILSPEQFDKQVQIKKNSAERVDFVVKMPGGSNKQPVLLPIDAKFPITAYVKMIDVESENKIAFNAARDELYAAVKNSAKSISEKYIDVPMTTNFALLYLPTEGLYAEIARDSKLCSVLQQKYRILVCGPTTLTALLNSLQIGFTTLKIQKQSGQVVDLMKSFQKDFLSYAQMLSSVKTKAGKVVEELDKMGDKTDRIQKKLDKVDQFNLTDDSLNSDIISIGDNVNEI